MTTIYYDDSGCGQGKTYRALEAITSRGGRHIYAADRIEAIEERARALRGMGSKESPLKTVTIYSNHDYRAVGPSVATQIEAVPSDYSGYANIVILITHEALKFANFEGFAGQGWSLWIDEVPAILDNDAHHFQHSWDKLKQFYDLAPLTDCNWSEVTKRDRSVDVASLALDDALQVLRPFDRRVADQRRKVLVNLTEWEELSVKRQKMTWFSVWSPEELGVFEAVFMLGNALTNSVTVRLWRELWPELVWQPMSAPRRQFRPRRVFITCFAEAHTASRKLFQSAEGKKNLTAIARYLQRLPSDDTIWTCNKPEIALLREMPGKWLTPKKAGSNDYAQRNHVVALYTSKPDDSMRLVLGALGLQASHFTETAEYETILQFVCRGSIREPDDQRDFHIYVYNRQQADYLLAYFRERASDYVLWPEVEVVNLGFAYEVRDTKRGRKRKVLTLAEQAKRAEKRKKGNRESKRRSRAAARALKGSSDVAPGASPPLDGQIEAVCSPEDCAARKRAA